MSTEERRSYANGIWMCQNHGHVIDHDFSITVEQLLIWKAGAEARALDNFRLSDGGAALNVDLTEISSGSRVNALVGRLLARSRMRDAWGRSEHGCIQDLLIELVRNAFQHGGAKHVWLEIDTFRVLIHDDGVAFNLADLRQGAERPTGGRLALRNIDQAHPHDLLVTHSYTDGRNETIISRIEALDKNYDRLFPCLLRIECRRWLDYTELAPSTSRLS